MATYVIQYSQGLAHIRKVFNGLHTCYCGRAFGPETCDVRDYTVTELLNPKTPVCSHCADAEFEQATLDDLGEQAYQD